MKQIVLLRRDLRANNRSHPLNIPQGKMSALFAHSCSHSVYYQLTHNMHSRIEEWMTMPHKICLAVEDEEHLRSICSKALSQHIFVLQVCYFEKFISEHLIFEETNGMVRASKYGTQGQSWDNPELEKFDGVMAACLGPDEDDALNSITGSLPLFKFL